MGPYRRGTLARRSGELARPLEHGVEHRLGQLARERVLLARVEAAEQHPAARAARARRQWPKRGRGPHAPCSRQRGVPGERAEATITRTSGSSSSSSAAYGRQLSRSAGSGLFAGGAQRTAAAIERVVELAGRRPARTDVGWFAKPVRCSEANSQSPERSPVKTRPVRLPPCAAGARPST